MRRQLAVLAAAFVITLPLITPRIYASDEIQYFAYLRSLWFDHDVSFENEYQHYWDAGIARSQGFHETHLERRTDTGRRISFATIGAAILWSPFYAVADALVALGVAGDGVRDGYGPPYVRAVAFGSALYGWLAIVLGWGMAHRLGLGRGALPAALAVWFGTPLVFYMYIAPPMAHACEAFAVAAFLAAWLHVRERWTIGGGVLLGALAALMVMVREQALFLVVTPAVDWAVTWGRGSQDPLGPPRRRLLAAALAGAAAFLIGWSPQLFAYLALNGAPRPSPLVARKLHWLSPHGFEVLFSPQHGLFFWTPLALLALLGLAAGLSGAFGWAARPTLAPRRQGASAAWIALGLLLAVLSQIYIAGSVESWTVAGAFGQRRFVGLSAVLLVGLAALWPRGERRYGAGPARVRALVIVLFVLGTWWNLGLMAQFGGGLMDRQRLTLADNAYHTFVTVPRRLPELVYRYVFARHSFYAPAAGSESQAAPSAPSGAASETAAGPASGVPSGTPPATPGSAPTPASAAAQPPAPPNP